MNKIGVFKIESSFKLTGRGLVALGQIIKGVVKTGSYINLEVNCERVTMKISGVEIADIDRIKGQIACGLTFVYKDKTQEKEFETLKLREQIVDILEFENK